MRHAEGWTQARVDLWSIRLDAHEEPLHCAAGAFTALAEEDHHAAARIRDEGARALFLAGRRVQRRILAAYVSQAPEALHIGRAGHGKPRLTRHPHLHFSFSRRGKRALLAVGSRPVGVDLDRHREGWQPHELMAVIGSPAECQRVAALPAVAHADAVMRCWTAKEACVKASGWGLALALPSFDVGPLTVDAAAPAWTVSLPSLTAEEPQSWVVRSLEVGSGWSAALAVSAQEPTAPLWVVARQWGAE